MRLYKGPTLLNDLWNQTLADLRHDNITNATNFDELEDGVLPGPPIEAMFDPTPVSVPRGLMEDQVYSTMAQIEVQFATPKDDFPISQSDFRSEYKDGFLHDGAEVMVRDWPGLAANSIFFLFPFWQKSIAWPANQ